MKSALEKALTPFLCPECGQRIWIQMHSYAGYFPYCTGSEDEPHKLTQYAPEQEVSGE